MKRKKEYRTIHEIRLAKERSKYDIMIQREKMSDSTGLILSDLLLSFKKMSLKTRSNLYNYSFFRTVIKTAMLYSVARSFTRLYKQSG